MYMYFQPRISVAQEETNIKEIINGESYIPLGTEEKEALNQALGLIEE